MGVADLTEADLAGYTSGNLTQADLAARAKVSRARIGAWLKAKGFLRPSKHNPVSGGLTPPPATSPAPSGAFSSDGTGELVEPSPEALADMARIFAINTLARANEAIAAGGLGPTQLKAAATAGREAIAELRRLGVLGDGAEKPEELIVRIMSSDDAEAMRQRIEAEAAGFDDFDEMQDDDIGNPDEDEAEPAVEPQEAPKPSPAPAVPPDLSQRLASFGLAHEQFVLRQLALSIGAVPARSLDALAASITEAANASPEALTTVLSIIEKQGL